MISVENFYRRIYEKYPEIDINNIKKAYEFAEKAHEGQTRISSGNPYIIHPLSVAILLTQINCDEAMIIGALLHDTVEDTDIDIEKIENEFGETIANIVTGLTKISKVEAIGLDRQVGSIRKMFLAMSKDIRVIYIKLADRLHNIQSINTFPLEKRKRISQETLSIYAPIATRLGAYFFKNPLEEISFKILYPEEYIKISKALESHNKKHEKVTEAAKVRMQDILQIEKIPVISISYRIKQKYSIFKKMQRIKENNIENIYDIFAIRIITNSIENCYKILGIIHKYWTPLPNRIKDYIAVPKYNGYKSLHTTILGLGKLGSAFKPVEIQIRTQEMHDEAEKGTAAHWQYKTEKEEKGKWIKSLVSIAQEIEHSNDEFLQSITDDTFYRRIFVLTPNGEVKDLPVESTPIDFAYSIHSDIGNHISVAKVNGKISPLDSALQNGDVIEIKTNKNREPNPAWITIVKTNQAKSSIKSWLRNQSTDNLLKLGRIEFNNLLSKIDKEKLDANYSILKEYKGSNLSLKDRESIIAQVGEGKQKASDIIKNIFYKEKIQKKDDTKKSSSLFLDEDNEKVLVLGDKLFKTKKAACCNPTTKDKITGFITRGGYVSIHKIDCAFVKNNNNEERFAECHWENEDVPFEVEFNILAKNIVGVAAQIFSFFAKNNMNILTMNIETNKATNRTKNKILIESNNLDKLSWVLDSLNRMECVIKADYIVKN